MAKRTISSRPGSPVLSTGAVSASSPTGSEGSRDLRGSKPTPGLYVVPTPIGNLRDITLRALDILAGVELIACEDTRLTARLLTAYGIATPTTSYHDHNAARVRPGLLRRLAAGGRVALVSDAGTPLVSDPGYRLLRAAIAAGVPVTVLPGASAATTALVAAGLPTDRFLFAGFLPAKKAAREVAIRDLAAIRSTLIFFESPQRLGASLAAMAALLGPREAAVARELTKKFEEVRRGTLAELAAHYAAAAPPKGEIVIVVGPPAAPETPSAEEVDRLLAAALETQTVRDAAAEVSSATGLPRRTIYARALALAGRDES